MTHQEFLMTKAEAYWDQGQPLPLDLFYELLSSGIDVDAAERKFTAEKEAMNG